MLQVSFWSRVATFLILAAGILVALPNALPQHIRDQIPRFLPHEAVNLGLDLQGGSYMLLEIQMDQDARERLESLTGDIRAAMRRAKIGIADVSTTPTSLSLRVTDPAHIPQARKIVDDLNPSLPAAGLVLGGRSYTVTQPGTGRIVMTMTQDYQTQRRAQVLEQSVQVVRRRIDEMGTREPTIAPSGDSRILVQVPGLSDPQRLIDLLKTTAKMTFQLVDENADLNQAMQGIVPIGDVLLPQTTPGAPPLVVQKRVMVAGDRLTNATAGYDDRQGIPNVSFRFDSVGARQFGNVTKDNVGKRFAIVLDNKIIEAPSIREAILGGSGSISGGFTTQTANDLAVLLRAGALPAPLSIVEQRTVGAELGADSINAGRYSAMIGLVLVALFMIARYGLFGVFADVALTLNIILLMAFLTAFGATLTLPGIAGIVLTMGMAVDANVLIFERIREEQRNGRSMLSAIDSGFRMARNTIVDANATHLIAALILFQLGSGPVRGFAVTLGVGIITSFFTAVFVTRLIVITWLKVRKPRRLAI